MDLDENKQIGSKYGVNSYPTLIYFKRGTPIKFGGSRTKEFMTFWLKKKTLPTIVPIEEEQLNGLQSDGNINIVFYGDLSSPKATILTKVAAADDYNSIQSSIKCITNFPHQVNQSIPFKSSDPSPKAFKTTW